MNRSKLPIVLFSIFLTIGIVVFLVGLVCLVVGLLMGYGLDAVLVGAIVSGMSLIYILIGGIGLFVIFRNKKRVQTLKQTGTRISADYVETIINTMVHVQYRNPYMIVCEWNNPLDGKKYLFKSGNIWFNPESIIREKGISKFDVYYEENNIYNYTVDTDCITKNVVDLS